MWFAISKCEVLLHDFMSVAPSLILDEEEPITVGHLTYLGSCLTNDSNSVIEVGMRIKGWSGLRWVEALVMPT